MEVRELLKLSQSVGSRRTCGPHLRLTRAGRGSLVLRTEDEFASMQETIALAADPVAQQEIAEADAAYAEGDFVTGDELRARFGLPPRVPEPYQLKIAGPAARSLEKVPERVAAAVVKFISGRLLENPQRIGKPLLGRFAGLHAARVQEYRVRYRINEDTRTVVVVRPTPDVSG